MSNQITRIDPTADNPDGIGFVPPEIAVALGKPFASGPGSASGVIAGPLVAFITEGGTVPLPATLTAAGTGFYYFQPMDNDTKLALPIDTPVGTRVHISDWEAAELAGPKQILSEADPSDEAHWTDVP